MAVFVKSDSSVAEQKINLIHPGHHTSSCDSPYETFSWAAALFYEKIRESALMKNRTAYVQNLFNQYIYTFTLYHHTIIKLEIKY